ncbi:hypothetical protein DFH06DRAFT_1227919 [Mycena polygramma]|nr:hypothetical protein DFH06DRAFT_1227919 [Mycena polygramma]
MAKIFYNFPPSEFPDSAVDRYPTLTCALGNSYPGLRSATSEDGGQLPFSSPSEPRAVPDPRLPAPFPPCIPAAYQTLSGRTSEASFKNSIWSNNSLSGWNSQPRAPPHAVSEAMTSSISDNLIPIRNSPTNSVLDTSDDPDLGSSSGSVGSPSLSPRGSSTDQTCEREGIRLKKHCRQKTRKCQICGQMFVRLCELKIHSNTHTGDQPFACDSPLCSKKYGVQSNLQRHRYAVHDAPRLGKAPTKPNPSFKIEFMPASLGAPVLSDTASMPANIAWDNEGPFCRRAVPSRAPPEDAPH